MLYFVHINFAYRKQILETDVNVHDGQIIIKATRKYVLIYKTFPCLKHSTERVIVNIFTYCITKQIHTVCILACTGLTKRK